MSDSYLRLIPTDPDYVPSSGQIQQALAIISANPLGSEPAVKITDDVEFIDAGTNLSAVYCPLCGSEINWRWWADDAMNRAYATRFRDLTIKTPCCGFQTNLNDLRYDWPCGFARFEISFLGPRRNLEPGMVERIAAALGTPLRKIWAHY